MRIRVGLRRGAVSLTAPAVVAVLAGSFIPAATSAAPVAYQTAVTADSPYVYYRLNQNPITTGTAAPDASGNARNATYIGSPTGGLTGVGLASDTAVAFNGTTSQYLDSTATGFGTVLGTSSYEFVFKANAGFSTAAQQFLFGTANTGSTTNAAVTLNATNGGATAANSVRLFVRDEAGNAAGFAFTNTSLTDGNYHDLIYTYTGGVATAYVDGVAQTVSKFNGGGTNNPGNGAAFAFDPFFAANNNRGVVATAANVTIDEAGLYANVLSATQAATHATASGVPEPSTLGLLGAGAGALLGRRRRRPA